jgi:hypothetical protein
MVFPHPPFPPRRGRAEVSGKIATVRLFLQQFTEKVYDGVILRSAD